MSVLQDLRAELAADVPDRGWSGGLNVYSHIPGRMNLPGAYVAAGSPYVEQGATFGSRLVRFDLGLCAHPAENDDETGYLDDLIEETIVALEAKGWVVEAVQQPAIFTFNNADVLVAIVSVSTEALIPTTE